VPHIAGHEDQPSRERDRSDTQVGFGQRSATTFQRCLQNTERPGSGHIEGQHGLRTVNDLLNPPGKTLTSHTLRAVDQLPDRDRGGELILRRHGGQPADEVQRRGGPDRRAEDAGVEAVPRHVSSGAGRSDACCHAATILAMSSSTVSHSLASAPAKAASPIEG
jgi:hypothetical protein